MIPYTIKKKLQKKEKKENYINSFKVLMQNVQKIKKLTGFDKRIKFQSVETTSNGLFHVKMIEC